MRVIATEDKILRSDHRKFPSSGRGVARGLDGDIAFVATGNAANAFHSVLPIEETYYLSPCVKTLSFFGICIERATLEHSPPHAESSVTNSSILAVPAYEVDV